MSEQHHEHKTEWIDEMLTIFKSGNSAQMAQLVTSLILKAKEEGRKEWENVNQQYQSREEAYERGKKDERERILAALATWIDGNIGNSSTAIYLYMTIGEIPRAFDAPRDSGDRGRCVTLLQALPEFIPRLHELEDLNLEGTLNSKPVHPWNEQIPLIRDAIEQEKKKE